MTCTLTKCEVQRRWPVYVRNHAVDAVLQLKPALFLICPLSWPAFFALAFLHFFFPLPGKTQQKHKYAMERHTQRSLKGAAHAHVQLHPRQAQQTERKRETRRHARYMKRVSG